MLESFETSLDAVLRTEGGYVNDPRDPGGPTNKGITLTTAREYISPSFTIEDLKAITAQDAGKVYQPQYWNKSACSMLPYGVDYATFDYGVNSGPARASHVLQAVAGVTQDGQIGPATLAALSARDPIAVIDAVCNERLKFLRSLSTWQHFGAGWSNRVAGVRTHAIAMAKSRTAPLASVQVAASLDMARQLPTGKGVAKRRSPAASPAGASSIAGATATVAATQHYVGGYAALGLSLAAVAGGAVLISKLQSNMDRAAVTPAPGTVAVAPVTAAVTAKP